MDIDIDCQTHFDPQSLFDVTAASQIKQQKIVKHPCGVYFQMIPVDPITKLAAIPYSEAEQQGYFKFDFLHLSVLDIFTSKDQLRKLSKIPPDWLLLTDPNVVAKLFHLRDQFKVVNRVRPKTVEELADCTALIRPGKRLLLDTYVKNKELARKVLYQQSEEGYTFKRSHAIAYAMTIVVQLHLIKGGIL